MIADTTIRNGNDEIIGVVDVVICGTCMEQGARIVGSATRQETDDLVQRVVTAEEENEKLKDEAASWQARYLAVIDLVSQGVKVDGNGNPVGGSGESGRSGSSGKKSDPERQTDSKNDSSKRNRS